MPGTSARDKLVSAAFRLFREQGFDATTVDQIASEAGVGRSTFFRNFRTKEDVVFPAHEPILAAVHARLHSSSLATADIALLEAAAIVLDHYLEEGDVARERYALTRSIASLRAAEIANQRDYQRVFREAAIDWGMDDLDAELVANGVVTAHNYVLRRWLRGLSSEPRRELAEALQRLRWMPSRRAGVSVALIDGSEDVEAVLARLRELLVARAAE